MDEQAIDRYLRETFDGVTTEEAWGARFYFVNPGGALTENVPYFTTLETADGGFRLSLGLAKATFQSLFAETEGSDATTSDVLGPHPVYGRQYWAAVLNPSAATFATLRPMLDEAYALALARYEKRLERKTRA